MRSYGISREEEYNLPNFKSHNEARKFFKDKYGNDFQMTSSDYYDGQKIYFYKLILNRKVFEEMSKELQENGHCAITEERMFCTQDIQIMQDGDIHIVH